METVEFTITLPMSFSGRVVNKIVSEINSLKSHVYLNVNNRTVNMKSILGLLSSNCNTGDNVTILCLNKDKSTAICDSEKLKQLFENGDF